MFNFSILTARTSATAFRQMRAFFCVFGVRVVDVFAVRKKFEIVQAVVCAVKVFMVDLKTPGYLTVKRLSILKVKSNG